MVAKRSAAVRPAIAPEGIATGFDGLPTIKVSKVVVAHFDDTAPLDLTTAAVATTVRSAFQTDTLMLRLRTKWPGVRSHLALCKLSPACRGDRYGSLGAPSTDRGKR
jgi:hypothetical protein